ncbi:MAG TPA: restriction endonuclease subunit S, partial [Candidatus Saccharibacteria bacterium]|nr:restriction endonuclease subunit S [Candidatus Saccharibacteria bacterium]
SITTGKKDVNAGNPKGKYRFYTCAKKYTYSDEYSFEGEAIMIAGNAEVGLCQYYSGKFEAYQRTYVLQNFGVNSLFLFKYLSHYFRNYALSLKQTGAMSFIKLGMLKDFVVPIPSNKEQEKVAEFLTTIDDKIEIEKYKLRQAKQFKKALLQRMFV